MNVTLPQILQAIRTTAENMSTQAGEMRMLLQNLHVFDTADQEAIVDELWPLIDAMPTDTDPQCQEKANLLAQLAQQTRQVEQRKKMQQ